MRTFAKLTWLELKLIVREPLAVVFVFAFPLVVLMVLIGSFEPNDPAFGGAKPSDYYLAGYVGVVIAAVGLISTPTHIAAYRERGVLRRFRASSLSPWSILAAQLAVGILTAGIGSLVLVLVGRVAFGAALPVSVTRVVLAFVLATASLLAVGFLLGSLARSARSAQAIGTLLFFPLWLLSGAGPPPEVMSGGMRAVSEALPLTYVVRALQDPWLGTGSGGGALALLAALLVAATLLSVRFFRTT